LIVLSNLVPNEITLESLALKQDAATLVLKGQIQASGAVAETALTQFMKKLEASDFFTEAALTSSKKEGLNQSFEIRCDISG
ncbi:MAG: PilN domain-containing protein, partial [Candidatus Omnitrophica bacterium]|nr:PilN domain-containing protein [Candidatus Omnitrophota bacterium]